MNKPVLVIGGGMAGLTAAAALAKAGRSVQLLEARGRLGGRVYSLASEANGCPVDLGPEFFHGEASELKALVGASGFVEPEESAFQFWRGLIQKNEGIFSKLEDWTKALSCFEPDRPLEEVFQRLKLSEQEAASFAAYLEGFNALELSLASQCALKLDGEREDESAIARPRDGYHAVWEAALSKVKGVEIFLNQEVKQIHWKKGAVEVACGTEGSYQTFYAEQAVITLPPSVWPFASLSPALPEKDRAASMLPLGPVRKVVFVLRHPLWETEGAGLSFLQSPELTFNAHWIWGVHAKPILSCWSGGGRARRMDGWSESRVVELAKQELGTCLKKSLAEIEAAVESVFFHDWVSDPFARGAYSYVKVGGVGAREAWAAPVEGTLFFAGEATCFDGSTGTVHGAMRSGTRAAEQVLRAQA